MHRRVFHKVISYQESVVAADEGYFVTQDWQQIFLYIADISGIFLHTGMYILNMGVVKFHKASLYTSVG